MQSRPDLFNSEENFSSLFRSRDILVSSLDINVSYECNSASIGVTMFELPVTR
jgi:hypothetical protein